MKNRFSLQQGRVLITGLYWKNDFSAQINTIETLSIFLDRFIPNDIAGIKHHFFTPFLNNNKVPSLGIAVVLDELNNHRLHPQFMDIFKLVDTQILLPVFNDYARQIKASEGNLIAFTALCEQIMTLPQFGRVKNQLLTALWEHVVLPCVDEKGQIPEAAEVFADCVSSRINYLPRKIPRPDENIIYGEYPYNENYYFIDVLELIEKTPTFREYLFIDGVTSTNRFEQMFIPHIIEGIDRRRCKKQYFSEPGTTSGHDYTSTLFPTATKLKLIHLAPELFNSVHHGTLAVKELLIEEAFDLLYKHGNNLDIRQDIHHFVSSLPNGKQRFIDLWCNSNSNRESNELHWLMASYLFTIPATQISERTLQRLKNKATTSYAFRLYLETILQHCADADHTLIEVVLTPTTTAPTWRLSNMFSGSRTPTTPIAPITVRERGVWPNPVSIYAFEALAPAARAIPLNSNESAVAVLSTPAEASVSVIDINLSETTENEIPLIDTQAIRFFTAASGVEDVVAKLLENDEQADENMSSSNR